MNEVQKKVALVNCQFVSHLQRPSCSSSSFFLTRSGVQETALEGLRVELQQSKADADESKTKHEAAIESITKTNGE